MFVLPIKFFLERSRSASLCKVRAHVLLQVEVGQLIVLTELEQAAQRSVRVDLAAIVLVLQVVLADVGVQLARDLGARHQSQQQHRDKQDGLCPHRGKALR